MDVRANRSDRAWVPWSIDPLENTLSSCTLHLISSHVLRYLLFSFGCSGEPVQSCVSSLKYDSLEKYSTFVYSTCIISSHIRIYLLFSYGCSGEPVRPCVSSLEYRFLWKIHYLRVFYIWISSHVQIFLIFFWMFGRTSPAVRDFPEVWFLWKIQHIRILYMHNIIHIRIYLLFSYGCSGEPVRPRVSSLEYRFLWKYTHLRVFYMQGEPVPCVSSLEYRFLWKIQHIRVLYMHNIISYTHISVIFLWMFGRTGPTVREFPEVFVYFDSLFAENTPVCVRIDSFEK